MAKRRLTPEEERALLSDIEKRRSEDADWEYERPMLVRVPKEATAVLSVRMPASDVRRLRELAARDRTSLSEILKRAIAAYAESGWDISQSSAKQATLYPSERIRSSRSLETKLSIVSLHDEGGLKTA